jgi:UDP-N-acetylglucosamine--N-acetylmuramyl-(pentapeptide) pyrophosphoryl-undecaprenol N-acetylglucosamine transferase
LVPFPFAAEDHQTKNAMNLVEKNAARMVKDSEMKENSGIHYQKSAKMKM